MCIICGCFCLVLQMPLWRSHFDGPVYSYRPMADLAPRAGDEPMRFCLQQKDAEKMSDFFRVGRIICGNAPGNLTGTVRNGTVMSHYPKHIFFVGLYGISKWRNVSNKMIWPTETHPRGRLLDGDVTGMNGILRGNCPKRNFDLGWCMTMYDVWLSFIPDWNHFWWSIKFLMVDHLNKLKNKRDPGNLVTNPICQWTPPEW